MNKLRSAAKRLLRDALSVSFRQDYPLTDVTSYFTEFDLASLAVLKTAPVWMSRAERLLLYTLTFTLRPERYLEIGTLRGGSALLVAAAMDNLKGNGRIICVEPSPQISPEDWQRLEARTTLLQGYSPDILGEAQSAAGGPFELILIDGDHSYNGVLRDAEGVLPYTADGAYLLFHDSFNPPVRQAIDDFVINHPTRILDCGPLTREITTVENEDGSPTTWGGLHLLQVRY
jgi:predicted O-methyltransferase YrrM